MKIAEEVATLGAFLADRLYDFENSMTSDEDAREWHGHVSPALSRFVDALVAFGSESVANDH